MVETVKGTSQYIQDYKYISLDNKTIWFMLLVYVFNFHLPE